MEAIERDCVPCEQDDPRGECPASKRTCGHHCNHIWTHDKCDWCGLEEVEDGSD